jgi:NAD(P)-dependent dehydrogenase (short-subunit alcohol dehydrogenase family)
MTSRFTDRLVVVTDAGSGIGRATAVHIVREGGQVVAADVDPVRLRVLADECGGKAAVTTVDGDLTDPAVVGGVVGAAGERIDGLANVAGIMDGFVPPAEVDDGTGEWVLSVNLTAVMRLTRAVLASMIAVNRGAIVNVAAEAALRATMPPAVPEQVAAAITWLLSDDSANVNDAMLPSDDGWSVA